MQFPVKRRFAFVLWNDAHSPNATDVYNDTSINTVHGSMPIITSGWVLKEDAQGLSLAAEYCGEGDYRGITYIPRQMCVEVVYMTPRQSRKRPPTDNIHTP
jgi:hypothetical protein